MWQSYSKQQAARERGSVHERTQTHSIARMVEFVSVTVFITFVACSSPAFALADLDVCVCLTHQGWGCAGLRESA